MNNCLSTPEFVAPSIPAEYQPFFPREIDWQRSALALQYMAESGISMRMELSVRLANQLNCIPESGTLFRLFRLLEDAGLIRNRILPLVGVSKLAFVHLTEAGQEFSRIVGWNCVESDWSRMVRLRSADQVPLYLSHTLEFSYQARLRKCEVMVAPENVSGNPDLLVSQYGEELPVFVLCKGVNILAVKKIVAETIGSRIGIVTARLCHRTNMVRLFSSALSCGAASDIESLIAQHRFERIGDLWLDHWA